MKISKIFAVGRLCAVLTIGMVTACVGVPQEQLIAYTDAFSEARDAGLLIYDSVAEPISEQGSASTGPSSDQFPATLGPMTMFESPCQTRYAGNADLVARCDAFVAVTSFNEALLALSQGASAASASQRIDSALGGVSALGEAIGVGGQIANVLAGPWVAPLKAILEEALAIRDRLVLKAHLEEGAPYVAQLLEALTDDVGKVYAIARADFALRLSPSEGEAVVAINEVLNAVNGRAPPTDPATRVLFQVIEARADVLLSRPEPAFTTKNLAALLNASGTALTAAQVAQLDEPLSQAEMATGRFDAIAAGWPARRDAMVAYRDMLRALGHSLDDLIAASNDPFSVGGSAAQLAQSMTFMRTKVREIELLLGQS